MQPVSELVDGFLAYHGLSPRGWSKKHQSGQSWLMKHYILRAWGVSEGAVTAADLAETLTVVEIELSRKGVEPLRSKVDRWGAVLEQLGACRAVV